MTCAEFDTIVHDVARPNALDKPSAVMAKFHAQTCERCAARFAQAQVLANALETVAQDSAALGAPAHLEPALVSAFREHRRSLERKQHRQRRTRLRWLEWSALAAAAAVLLAIGAWNFSRPRVNGTDKNPNVVVQSPVNFSASDEAQQAALVETATADDSSSDFIPLPYGESLSADDSGLVVRVSMTRSALGSLGYPVDEVHAGDVVQADLLVGEDGLPRAVRLVQ
ncbi:MAG: hypothetical protein ACRD4A_07275 [Candidatus Acidiferrales bacterium]